MSSKSKLYLISSDLGEYSINSIIPIDVQKIISDLKYFGVENIRSARRFLKQVDKNINIDQLTFFEIDKHQNHEHKQKLILALDNGNDVGVLSEAGNPSIADPGASITLYAHKKGHKVIPLVGPSSIFMALSASGLNGQSFTFNGYIPVKKGDRIKRIKQLEKNSKFGSQIFMETPYRNQHLFNDLIENCFPTTLLCIAINITHQTEDIRTKTIKDWKKSIPNLHKQLCIFILGQ